MRRRNGHFVTLPVSGVYSLTTDELAKDETRNVNPPKGVTDKRCPRVVLPVTGRNSVCLCTCVYVVKSDPYKKSKTKIFAVLLGSELDKRNVHSESPLSINMYQSPPPNCVPKDLG